MVMIILTSHIEVRIIISCYGNFFHHIQKYAKGIVVVVNKWDLVENKTDKVMKEFENAIRNRFAPFVDIPIIFTSAQNSRSAR
jgi:predicted GTPase